MHQLAQRLALCLWLAMAGSAPLALAQGSTPTAPPGATGPIRPEANYLAAAAAGVGIVQCQTALSRLSDLAIMGSKSHDVLLDWDRKPGQADKSPFFSLLGIEYANGAVAATVTGIPVARGGCTVMAERISVAPFACKGIAEVELKAYRVSPLLPTFTVYTDPADPGASVSLIDSPPGCLVIRRYVQYNWLPPTGAAK